MQCPNPPSYSLQVFIVQASKDPLAPDFRQPTSVVPDEMEEGAKHGIKFSSTHALDAFYDLTASRCYECAKKSKPAEFPCFPALRHHVQQDHRMSFCQLCVENMNALVKDFKLYTWPELKAHKNGRMSEAGFEEGNISGPTADVCSVSNVIFSVQATPSASTARSITTTPRPCTAI